MVRVGDQWQLPRAFETARVVNLVGCSQPPACLERSGPGQLGEEIDSGRRDGASRAVGGDSGLGVFSTVPPSDTKPEHHVTQ